MLALVVVFVLLFAQMTNCTTILVSPICDSYNESCTAMSDVEKFIKYEMNFSGPIELMLLPGNHLITNTLVLNSSLEYRIVAVSLINRPLLTCEESALFSVTSSVYIEGLQFHNCIISADIEEGSMLIIDYSSFCGSSDYYIQINDSKVSISNSEFLILLHIIHSDVALKNSSMSYNSLSGLNFNYSSYNAVLTISDSEVIMSDVKIANNSVREESGAVVTVYNSVLSINNTFVMTNNTGKLLHASSSTLDMSDTVIITQNCGVLKLSSCELKFEGFLNVANNFNYFTCPHGPSGSGIITIYNSTTMFKGNIHISNNMLGAFYLERSSSNFVGNTHLCNNIGIQGGAMFISNAVVNFDSAVSIINNTAANFGGALYLYQSTLTFRNTALINHNKVGKNGGGFFSYLSQINFYWNSELQNNIASNGGGMYVISSRIRFYSSDLTHQVSIRIAYNQAQNGSGGGIYLTTNSKIQLLKYDRDLNFYDSNSSLISVYFIENNASIKGGGIFVDDYTDFPTCTPKDELLSDCFIQTLEVYSFSAPVGRSDKQTNVFFVKNSAQLGNSFYGGLTDHCIKAQFSEQSNFSKNYEIENPNFYDRDSEPLSVQLCSSDTIEIYKGQSINISLAAYNQNLRQISTQIFVRVDSGHGGLKEGEDIQEVLDTCSTITFNVISSEMSENVTVYPDGPCRDSELSGLTLPIIFKQCPIGFQVSDSSTECICDSIISSFICDIESETITRYKNNSWITYINTSNASGILMYPYCPYGYCQPPSQPVRIDLHLENGSDSQCAYNRSGILCGGCQDGLSVVIGSSNCKKCGYLTLFLVIPIATAGVILVFLIMFLNFTVDIGTINGLILYCNTMAVLNSQPTPVYTNFIIEWINLGLGFETCFYNGMDEYSRAWLEFAFPMYLITLVIIMMTTSEKSSKLARLLGSSNPVATLATLIFISYARLLRASMNIISLGIVTYPDEHSEYVWLVDANILYLRGKHVPLFLAGMGVLMTSMVYTIYLALQHLVPCECIKVVKWLDNPKLKSFMDAYHAPFMPTFRGWYGVLLLYRFIVFLVSSLNYNGDQQINLFCVAILSFGTISIKNMCGRVYKTWVSHIETVYILNLGMFSVAQMYVGQIGGSQHILVYSSHCVAIITLLCIFLIHLDIKFKFVAKLTKIKKKVELTSEGLESVGTISTEFNSTSSHYTTISDSSKRTGTKTESQVSTAQHENRGLKSFNQLREELLDF